jgi:stage II sporulation protein D
VLCLFFCTALLWAAWKITSVAGEQRSPELQFWPFGRSKQAAPPVTQKKESPTPVKKPAAAAPVILPPEQMPSIRVGLLKDPQKSVTIEVSQPFVVRPVGSETVLFRSERQGPTSIKATAKGFKFGKREIPAAQFEIIPNQSPAVWVEGHQYRGTVRFHRQPGNQITAVNVLPLEDYVASVVDSEMPAAFPDEARKAQAIVARTYALYQMQVAERGSTADLFASTRSQKYLGYQYRDGGKLLAGESEASRKIAAATRGQVCQFRGKIFCTYYCAVCGGNTVLGTEVFSDAAQPLVSVPCDFCREARLYRWTAEISKADIQKDLDPWLKEKGQPAATIKTVSQAKPIPVGKSLPEFDIRAGQQTTRISGAELRQLLAGRGLYSPRFTIADRGKTLEISGKGHGHGVGLCQWGARGQALAGRNCPQILGHYYPGMTLVTRTWK